MTVTVSKSTIVENLYKNFYDLISTVSGITTSVFPAFPENITLTDKASYPIVVIDSPEIGNGPFTFGKGITDGTIDVDVYTQDAKTCDEYSSDIIDKIETSKGTLATIGLKQVHLNNTQKEVLLQGEIRVHHKMITFKYKFYYTKTATY